MEDDRSFVTSSRDGTKVAVESTDVADVDEATSEAADDTTGAVVVFSVVVILCGCYSLWLLFSLSYSLCLMKDVAAND